MTMLKIDIKRSLRGFIAYNRQEGFESPCVVIAETEEKAKEITIGILSGKGFDTKRGIEIREIDLNKAGLYFI